MLTISATGTDLVQWIPPILVIQREREMFHLTTHSTHFIYGYMASDIWLRTILIVRKETRCRHIGCSYRLTARVLIYAPSHRQDNTYHGFCYTSRGALAGTRNSSIVIQGYLPFPSCGKSYLPCRCDVGSAEDDHSIPDNGHRVTGHWVRHGGRHTVQLNPAVGRSAVHVQLVEKTVSLEGKEGNVLFNDALNTFTVIWHLTYGKAPLR